MNDITNKHNNINNNDNNSLKRSSTWSIGDKNTKQMLIVTSKNEIESWANLVRQNLHLKLLVYTDTLAKRRQLGCYHIIQHDVIITTFDVIFISLNFYFLL